jgi:hypothetical protein
MKQKTLIVVISLGFDWEFILMQPHSPIAIGLAWVAVCLMLYFLYWLHRRNKKSRKMKHDRKPSARKFAIPKADYESKTPMGIGARESYDWRLRRGEITENKQRRSSDGRHLTKKGYWVRSTGEQIVADTLFELGLSFEYERPWRGENNRDTREPDFTIYHKGHIYIWEHLGMLGNSQYRRKHERNRNWYESYGYKLIESEDPPGFGKYISKEEVKRIVRSRLNQ